MIRFDLTESEAAVVLAALQFMATFAPGQPQTEANRLWQRLLAARMGAPPASPAPGPATVGKEEVDPDLVV